MKKIIIFSLLLLFIALLVQKLFGMFGSGNLTTVLVDGTTYKVLVADNEIEHAKGLMGVTKLENADGMIFVFPDKQYRTFWNKNTLVDLDIYWMEDDKVIGKTMLPSIKNTGSIMTVSSPGPSNRVVEIIRN